MAWFLKPVFKVKYEDSAMGRESIGVMFVYKLFEINLLSEANNYTSEQEDKMLTDEFQKIEDECIQQMANGKCDNLLVNVFYDVCKALTSMDPTSTWNCDKWFYEREQDQSWWLGGIFGLFFGGCVAICVGMAIYFWCLKRKNSSERGEQNL